MTRKTTSKSRTKKVKAPEEINKIIQQPKDDPGEGTLIAGVFGLAALAVIVISVLALVLS